MLKIVGVLFIVTGSVGFGNYLCSYLKYHLAQLLECREIFARIDAEKEYLRLPYAQLLRRTAKGRTAVFGAILTEIADELEKNREADVKMIWEAVLQEHRKELLLTSEEIQIMIMLAKSLTLEGNSSKVSEMYFLQLEDEIVQAMEEKKEKQKLYGTVSVLFGIFLVILLL